VADLFTGSGQFPHYLAMPGPQVLDLGDKTAFFLLAGKDFMQQRRADQHDRAEHDRGIGIDTGEDPREHQGDCRRDDGIAKGYQDVP
jgi:hypothetical protein